MKAWMRVSGWMAAAAASWLLLAGCESNSDVAEDSGGASAVLAVNPDYVSIPAVVTNVVLSASGGSGIYTWSVSDPDMGTITANGDWAVYTSAGSVGANTVTVSDDRGNSATAGILQN